MRGTDERTGELFSYVDLEKRVPAKHPLRLIRGVVNEVLAALDSDFSKAYADSGRPSIAPERLLRASLRHFIRCDGVTDRSIAPFFHTPPLRSGVMREKARFRTVRG